MGPEEQKVAAVLFGGFVLFLALFAAVLALERRGVDFGAAGTAFVELAKALTVLLFLACLVWFLWIR